MTTMIFYCIIGLISIYQAFRIKRDPKRVYAFKRVIDKQLGEAYEAGMQKYYYYTYLATGLAWILAALFGWLFGFDVAVTMLALLLILVLLPGAFIAKLNTGKVMFWHWMLLVLCVAALVFCHLWNLKESKVEVYSEKIAFEQYWFGIDYQSIDSVKVVDKLPRTVYSYVGESVLGNKKGEFRLRDGSRAKFYVLSKEAPYLEMYTNSGLILVNRKTAEETEQLIEELKEKIGNKIVKS